MEPEPIYTDCMVDIETTGTRPDRAAIIQIAAVKFNLNERTVSPNTFVRSLKIPPWRSWQEDTREWWGKQPGVLADIMSRAEDPKTVMQDFFDWSVPAYGHKSLKFWARPISFDFPFIASYMNDFDEPMTFDFREAMDLRSYIRGLYAPSEVDWTTEPEFVGVQHNAYADTLHQIKMLFHFVDKAEGIVDAEFEPLTKS
jgi:DNA polymerase III epsilon subunit-like protein